MRNGKYAARRTSGTKAVSLLLAVLVLVGCSVGATLAWLTATSDEVKNTFTVGKVDITLQEHQYVEASNTLNTDATVDGNTYKLIPGKNMPKDPFVTVAAGSEKCWLFVRIDEANNQPAGAVGDTSIVRYEMDDDVWKQLPLTGLRYDDGIEFRYRIVDSDEINEPLYVLKKDVACSDNHTNGCVTVLSSVTSGVQNPPVLKFTAAAIQYDGLEVVDPGDGKDDYEAQAALKAFNNLPEAFRSTTNLNTPVTPTPDPES